MPRATFQLRTRNLFLTYPQCPIELNEAMRLLKLLFARWEPKTIIVGQENHQETGQHLHVLVVLSRIIQTRNARFADVNGYHGNYQVARSVRETARYITRLTMRFIYFGFLIPLSNEDTIHITPGVHEHESIVTFYLNDGVYNLYQTIPFE